MNPSGNTLTNPWTQQKQLEFKKPQAVGVWETLPSITIDISNEKGGTFIKHTNYVIYVDDQSIIRRYSDFDLLNSELLKRYPSRLMLQLPPKKFSGNKETDFLIQRKQGLLRYLLFVYRHPIINKDDVLADFLSSPVFLKKDWIPSIDNDALVKKIFPPVYSIFSKYSISPPEDLHVIDLGWLFEWESLSQVDENALNTLLLRRSTFLHKLEAAIMTYHRLSVLAVKLQRKHKVLNQGTEMQEIIAKITCLVEEKQDFIHLDERVDNISEVVELNSVTHTPITSPNHSQGSSKKEIKLHSHEAEEVLLNRDSFLSHFKTLGTKLYLIQDHHLGNQMIYFEFVQALKIRRDMLMHFKELIKTQQNRFKQITGKKSSLIKAQESNVSVEIVEDDLKIKEFEFELELIQHIVESEYRLLMEYTGLITFIFQNFIKSMMNYTHQTYLMWNDLNDNMSEWPSEHLI